MSLVGGCALAIPTGWYTKAAAPCQGRIALAAGERGLREELGAGSAIGAVPLGKLLDIVSDPNHAAGKDVRPQASAVDQSALDPFPTQLLEVGAGLAETDAA